MFKVAVYFRVLENGHVGTQAVYQADNLGDAFEVAEEKLSGWYDGSYEEFSGKGVYRLGDRAYVTPDAHWWIEEA